MERKKVSVSSCLSRASGEILARKAGLSQVFEGPGKLVPVTMFELFHVGDQIVNRPSPGMKVSVLAKPKGKGFQGNQKRHGFRRGPMTHGSKNHRLPGSIGAGGPGRVFRGKKMAGRGGARCVLARGLEVLCASYSVSPDFKGINGRLILKGTTAGGVGSDALIKVPCAS
jgi:large subunit ribosomal protein L3